MSWIRGRAAGTAVGGQAPAVEPDDAALVAAALANPHRFVALYERYLHAVYRYCYVRLNCRDAAEDATSEVFIKAFAALQGYRGGRFPAWLFRIARNVVYDAYRRSGRREPIEAAEEIPRDEPTLEEQIVAEEERLRLRAALERLSVDQREVLELQLAGWSTAQIADALDRSPAAVKMLRFRAISRLREQLALADGSPSEVGCG